MSWRCYGPPPETPAEQAKRRRIMRASLKASLDTREYRRCVALKGWRTRKLKEKANV